MIRRVLYIGRWKVDFLFAVDSYDREEVLSRLYDTGASGDVMRRIERLMDKSENTGFTFTNPELYKAVVAVGPTSSGEEFVDTFVHESYHLAVAIASRIGIDLEGETPAYIAGDSARELADIVCRLGCPCNH